MKMKCNFCKFNAAQVNLRLTGDFLKQNLYIIRTYKGQDTKSCSFSCVKL